MRCPANPVLHDYVAGTLPHEDRALVEAHLPECLACSDSLAQLRTSTALLRAAATVKPNVDWAAVDDRVLTAAAQRLGVKSRWRAPAWGFAAAAMCAALATFIWAPWRTAAPPPPAAPLLADVTIEAAEGARIAGTEGALQPGDGLAHNAAIHTDDSGTAQVSLPEESRARIAPRSKVTVAQATKADIHLVLDQGEVAITAAHAPRNAFLVSTRLVDVRVVGTVFRVAHQKDGVVVSVAQGRVLIEPRQGDGRLIDAGQRARVNASGQVELLPLAGDDHAAFQALGVDSEPRLAAAPIAPPAERPRRAPRPQKVAAPAPVEPSPAAADDWALPKFRDPEPLANSAPGLSDRARKSGLPKTAEGLFLQRASESLKTGRCGNYLLGLQDVVEGSEDIRARELARILRARCFEERLDPVAAGNEYRRYLQQHPFGRFSSEARRATEE